MRIRKLLIRIRNSVFIVQVHAEDEEPMLEFEEDDPDSGKKYRDIYYGTKNREGGGGHCRWRKKR